MSLECHYDDANQQLVLAGELTIYQVAKAKAAMADHAGAILNLAEIEDLDGAGLQLLLAARRDVGMRPGPLSAAAQAVLELAGLGEWVGKEA